MFTKKIEEKLLSDIILFILGIAAISLLYKHNFILTILLLLFWIFALKFWHLKHDFYFFITAMIIGPIAEIVAIYFKVWSYSNPTFLGIPIWLPLVWGFSVILIKRFSEIFIKINSK